MKSIKLATGFAVSALALAIAGQATAQTTDVTFSGDLKFQTILDIENGKYFHQMPGLNPTNLGGTSGATGSQDWYNFTATWNLRSGPFSGRLRLGTFGHTGTAAGTDSRSGDGLVMVDNLRVTEGPIQFGQVTRLTDTATLYESLTKQTYQFQPVNNSGNDIGDESTRFNVDLGFRYTVSDLGLRVQAESRRDAANEALGFGASLIQDLDVAKLWVDGQYRVNTTSTGMANNANYNVGVAIQAKPVDQLVLTGVYRLVTDNPATLDPRSVYAVRLDVDATNELSLYGMVTDSNVNDIAITRIGRDALNADVVALVDSTVVQVGLAASFDPVVVEVGYEANYADLGSGLIFTSATWTDGPLSAFVGFDYNLEGFDGAPDAGYELSLGGSFTTDSSIEYGAEYTYSRVGGIYSDVNKAELYASYSF